MCLLYISNKLTEMDIELQSKQNFNVEIHCLERNSNEKAELDATRRRL